MSAHKEEREGPTLPRHEQDALAFRQAVKRLRKHKGWTQNQLATELRKAGMTEFTQVAVARLERGERSVKLGEAGVIADVLDSTLAEMTTPDEPARRPLTNSISLLDKMEKYASDAIGFTAFYEMQRYSLALNLEELVKLKSENKLSALEMDVLKSRLVSILINHQAPPITSSSLEIHESALYYNLRDYGVIEDFYEVRPYLSEIEERLSNALEQLGLLDEILDEELKGITVERLQELSSSSEKYGLSKGDS